MTQDEKITAAFIRTCKKHHMRPNGQCAEEVFDMFEAGYLAALADLKAKGPDAEVVWFDPELSYSQQKAEKIIDGTLAFMDTARLGDKLYRLED